VRLLLVADFSPATVMMLADRVAAGEFIAIAGDRIPLRGDRVVRGQFLDRAAWLPMGPWLLASLLSCPVYAIACLREGRGYRANIVRLAERVVLPRARREAALREHVDAFLAWIEAQLRGAPYQWFNFFPFWDQTPNAPAPH
jgi:predicted LPLAT superfamily acyltransferase